MEAGGWMPDCSDWSVWSGYKKGEAWTLEASSLVVEKELSSAKFLVDL